MRLMVFFIPDQISMIALDSHTVPEAVTLLFALFFSVVPADFPQSSSRRAAGGEWFNGTGQAVRDQRVHRGSVGGQRFF